MWRHPGNARSRSRSEVSTLSRIKIEIKSSHIFGFGANGPDVFIASLSRYPVTHHAPVPERALSRADRALPERSIQASRFPNRSVQDRKSDVPLPEDGSSCVERVTHASSQLATVDMSFDGSCTVSSFGVDGDGVHCDIPPITCVCASLRCFSRSANYASQSL